MPTSKTILRVDKQIILLLFENPGLKASDLTRMVKGVTPGTVHATVSRMRHTSDLLFTKGKPGSRKRKLFITERALRLVPAILDEKEALDRFVETSCHTEKEAHRDGPHKFRPFAEHTFGDIEAGPEQSKDSDIDWRAEYLKLANKIADLVGGTMK